MRKRLSVILPAFNEEENIDRAVQALAEVLEPAEIPYELLFVDDGSTDRTWERILGAAQVNARVTGIHFSRNFGKEAAIYAGLGQATGDAVAVMDCDLQHPPSALLEMYERYEEGYDLVEGVKSDRGRESSLHGKSAALFYRLMSGAVGVDMQNASDFKLMDRKVVQAILSLPERNMFFRATASWVGYRTATVYFTVQERQAGTSKWGTFSLIRYAFRNIVSFTTAPLQLVSFGGILCLLFSVILAVYSLIMKFTGNAVSGYTTLLIVMLFIGSSVMISLGIIGYYIARIYEEVKHRPRYIISSVVQRDTGVKDLLNGSENREQAGIRRNSPGTITDPEGKNS